MNSPPRRMSGQAVVAKSKAAIISTVFGRCIVQSIAGRSRLVSQRLTGVDCSGGIFPRISKPISNGTHITEKIAAWAIASDEGQGSWPANCPLSPTSVQTQDNKHNQ